MVREHIEKIPVRREDSHKGDYGRVFIVAGSPGMTGAAYLTAQAALRAGSGLVTCGIPSSLNDIMEVKLTEALTLQLEETEERCLSFKAKKRILDFCSGCDAAAIGPGLGGDESTRILVRELVSEIEIPVVLDADGINALEGSLETLKRRKQDAVITPHPGEMSSLTGKDISSVQADRENAARTVAEATGKIVCLKGHRTVVAGPDGRCYVNDTGNSGMATGGMGDVLTGMIASFIGQGLEPYSAAVVAVYLHGSAGDIVAEEKGPFSMIATDVLEAIPEAFDKAGI